MACISQGPGAPEILASVRIYELYEALTDVNRRRHEHLPRSGRLTRGYFSRFSTICPKIRGARSAIS